MCLYCITNFVVLSVIHDNFCALFGFYYNLCKNVYSQIWQHIFKFSFQFYVTVSSNIKLEISFTYQSFLCTIKSANIISYICSCARCLIKVFIILIFLVIWRTNQIPPSQIFLYPFKKSEHLSIPIPYHGFSPWKYLFKEVQKSNSLPTVFPTLYTPLD